MIGYYKIRKQELYQQIADTPHRQKRLSLLPTEHIGRSRKQSLDQIKAEGHPWRKIEGFVCHGNHDQKHMASQPN